MTILNAKGIDNLAYMKHKAPNTEKRNRGHSQRMKTKMTIMILLRVGWSIAAK
jgi:hypothetical protein